MITLPRCPLPSHHYQSFRRSTQPTPLRSNDLAKSTSTVIASFILRCCCHSLSISRRSVSRSFGCDLWWSNTPREQGTYGVPRSPSGGSWSAGGCDHGRHGLHRGDLRSPQCQTRIWAISARSFGRYPWSRSNHTESPSGFRHEGRGSNLDAHALARCDASMSAGRHAWFSKSPDGLNFSVTFLKV
jgi:hypothetical protein